MKDGVPAVCREDVEKLEDLLRDHALLCDPIGPIVETVGRVLSAAGGPVAEIRMTARTLHPAVDAIGVHWWRGGEVKVETFSHDESDSKEWLRSPLRHMIETDLRRMRRRLVGADAVLDFPVFADFRAGGVTDFLAHLTLFGDRPVGRRNGLLIRWLSDAPAGFPEPWVALLDALAPRLAAAALPGIQQQIARNLLDAYVGPRSGERVLRGTIQPGDDQAIEAVILVADLAGFTALSDRLPADRLTRLLDRHFQAMLGPLVEGGGEILAFLGDGVLAAFEIDGDPVGRCRAALDAAVEAVTRVDALGIDAIESLPLEIGLHMGAVRHGNVGAAGRQAFTVIGPAVNAASRIETLCGTLGHRILVSEPVARAVRDARLVPVGAHALRGLADPMALYAVTSIPGP